MAILIKTLLLKQKLQWLFLKLLKELDYYIIPSGQKREAREARQRSSQILYIPNMRSLHNGSYTGCLCRYDVIKNNMSYLNQKLATTQVTVY